MKLCAFSFVLVCLGSFYCAASAVAQSPSAREPHRSQAAAKAGAGTPAGTKAKAQTAQPLADDPAARADRIMSKEELRACLLEKLDNDRDAQTLRADQQAFARDFDAVRAEQADVAGQGEAIRARSQGLRSEYATVNARLAELQPLLAGAKSDEDKARYEQERQELLARRRQNDNAREQLGQAQREHAARVDALNVRIDAINAKSRTVNDRVEPLQARVEAWKAKCGNRRYREEDEIALRKELGIR